MVSICVADTEEHVDAILKFVVEKQGGLDILMVASGFNKPGNSQQATLADFNSVMDANVSQIFPDLPCRWEVDAGAGPGREDRAYFIGSI